MTSHPSPLTARVKGEPLPVWLARQPEGDETDLLRARLCGRGIDAFLKMMFQDNFVHGDLHPGNIMVTPDEQLAFIDAGIALQYADEDHQLLISVLANFMKHDGVAAAKLLMASSENSDGDGSEACLDPEGFEQKIHAMVLMARDHPSFFEKVGECYSIICNAACDHRVKIRSGFMSIALSVKAVEGTAMSLAPNIELARLAKARAFPTRMPCHTCTSCLHTMRAFAAVRACIT